MEEVKTQKIRLATDRLVIRSPKENVPLQQRILENGGLILSEQPFGVRANPTNLVARNRLLFRHTAFGTGPTPSKVPKAADSPHSTDTDSEHQTLEYPLTLNVPCTLRPAKCAAPQRAGSRVAPEGSCLSAAASPRSAKVLPSHRYYGASLT